MSNTHTNVTNEALVPQGLQNSVMVLSFSENLHVKTLNQEEEAAEILIKSLIKLLNLGVGLQKSSLMNNKNFASINKVRNQGV